MSKSDSPIVGLGNDIIEIERIAQALERHGQTFLDRIFTKQEQEYCRQYKDPLPHYAGRFAAKEAVSKALGVGIGKDLGWLDMEILNNEEGAPRVVMCAEVQKRLGPVRILVSLSHCKAYASAVAIVTV